MSPQPPEVQAALDAEHVARSLAYLPIAADICGAPIVPLTPRMRLELELAGNAFFATRRALLADIFDFLWRLNPHFARPVRPRFLAAGFCPPSSAPRLRLLRAWQAFGTLSAARQFVALERLVRGMDLFAVEREIHLRLRTWRQDRPASSTSSESSASSLMAPQRHWLDNLVAYFLRHSSMSVAEILDTPLALLYQLHREGELLAGREVIDPSAALISQAHRAARSN